MNIAELANKRAKRTFDFDGEPVTIEFLPHKITPEYRARLDAGETGEDGSGDARMLADILVGWDVLDGETPFPPTFENLCRAPQTLLSRTAAEILMELGKLAMPAKPKK